MNDNTEYLKGLADAELKRKNTELDQQRAQALLDVQRNQETTMPTFTAQKQQANVASQIGAKNFAEYWANRGQANAGIASQYEMSRQNTLANQIGGITGQENAALNQFNQQRADIGTNYTNQLTNANNEINANLQTNLYNEKLRKEQAAIDEENARIKAEQDAYDRAIALDNENYDRWATETKMGIDQANKDRDFNYKTNKDARDYNKESNKPVEGSTKLIGGKPNVYVNGKWSPIDYGKKTTSVSTKKRIDGKEVTTENDIVTYDAPKQEKWNKKNYWMVSGVNTLPTVTVKGKPKTYQLWENRNTGNIGVIIGDNSIDLTDKAIGDALKAGKIDKKQAKQLNDYIKSAYSN